MKKIILLMVAALVLMFLTNLYYGNYKNKNEIDDKGYYILYQNYIDLKNSKAGLSYEQHLKSCLEDGFISYSEYEDLTGTTLPSLLIKASDKEYHDAKTKLLIAFKVSS